MSSPTIDVKKSNPGQPPFLMICSKLWLTIFFDAQQRTFNIVITLSNSLLVSSDTEKLMKIGGQITYINVAYSTSLLFYPEICYTHLGALSTFSNFFFVQIFYCLGFSPFFAVFLRTMKDLDKEEIAEFREYSNVSNKFLVRIISNINICFAI